MYQFRRSIAIGKRLERKINQILVILILVFLLPIFITTFCSRMKVEELILDFSKNPVSEIERMLPGIVAKEIGILKPDECIKAQAVIARTNLMSADKLGQDRPEGLTVAQLQEMWGENYELYYEKLERLIAETADLTLSYQGDLIYAAFHQVSAGDTRSMPEFAGVQKMPYLASVPCHEDAVAENYLGVYFWEKEEFLQLMERLFPEEEIVNCADVWVLKRDSAGYVLQVQVGQTLFDGEEFRNRLSLPSSCFEITMIEEDVRIVTMGCGHGFGLSQHMAEYMAKNGADYQEILEYFYKGVVLTE